MTDAPFHRAPLTLTFRSIPEIAGLVIYARRLSMREIKWVSGLEEAGTGDRITSLCAMLAGSPLAGEGMEDVERKPVIKRWNYCDDDSDEPLPITEATLSDVLDPGVVNEVATAVVRRSMRVSPPLPEPSSDGTPSETSSAPASSPDSMPSMPMVTLPASSTDLAEVPPS